MIVPPSAPSRASLSQSTVPAAVNGLRRLPTLTLLATASLLAAGADLARAAENQQPSKAEAAVASNEALLKQLQAMERRIQSLEGQLKQKQGHAGPTAAATPVGCAATRR